MKNEFGALIILFILSASLLTATGTVQLVKQETSLSPSWEILGAGIDYAANGGKSALFVSYKDNYLAHHLTDGVNWVWLPESSIEKSTVPVAYMLQQLGFIVESVGDIPENLSSYDVVVINAQYAVEPKHEPLIRNYVLKGGGVVLVWGVPMYFGGYCKDEWPGRLGLDDLSPIEEWFGAKYFVNSGGNSYATINNPLGTTLREGDIVLSTPNHNVAAMSFLHNDSQILSHWQDGWAFAFVHTYGQGRVYYQAAFDTNYQVPIPTEIALSPQQKTISPDNTFSIKVVVSNVTSLYAWEVTLYYLNSVVAGVNCTEGPFLNSSGPTTFLASLSNDYNATHGRIIFGGSFLGANDGVNGSGVLASITFRAIAAGNSVLSIHNAGTYLLDDQAKDILFNSVDGQISVVLLTDLNGDGKVDIRDIAIVALAYGSYLGHPKWNPTADLNSDNKVDIRDLAMVAKDFGKYIYT